MEFLKVAIIFFVIFIIFFVIFFIIDYPIIAGLIVLLPLLIRWLVNKKAKNRLNSLHSKDVEEENSLEELNNYRYEYVHEEYTYVTIYGTISSYITIFELLPLDEIDEMVYKLYTKNVYVYNRLASTTKVRPVPHKISMIVEECKKNKKFKEEFKELFRIYISDKNKDKIALISDIDGKQFFYCKGTENYFDISNIGYATTSEKLDFLKSLNPKLETYDDVFGNRISFNKHEEKDFKKVRVKSINDDEKNKS